MSKQESCTSTSSPPGLIPLTPSSSPRLSQDDDNEESREGEQKDGAMTNHREPKEGVRSPGKQQRRRLYPRMIRKEKTSKKDVMTKAGNDDSLVEPTTDDARSEADDESLAASNAKADFPERNRSRCSPRRLMRRGHTYEKSSTNSHQTVDYGVKEKKPPLWVRSGTVHWVKAGSEQSGNSDVPTGHPKNTSLTEHQLSSDCKMWVKIVDFVCSLVEVIVYALIVAQKLPCIGHTIFVVGVKVKVAGAFVLGCFSCLFTRGRQERRIRRSKLAALIFSRKMFLLLVYLATWDCFVKLAIRPLGYGGHTEWSTLTLKSLMPNLRSQKEYATEGVGTEYMIEETVSPIGLGEDTMFNKQPSDFEGDATSILPVFIGHTKEDAPTASGPQAFVVKVRFSDGSEYEASGGADNVGSSQEISVHSMDADAVLDLNGFAVVDEEITSKIEDLVFGASESVYLDEHLLDTRETSAVGMSDMFLEWASVDAADAIDEGGSIGVHVESRLSNGVRAESESAAGTSEGHFLKTDFEFGSVKDGIISIMIGTSTDAVRRHPPRFMVPFSINTWRKDSVRKAMEPSICRKPPPFLNHIRISPFQPPSSMSDQPNTLTKGLNAAAMTRTTTMAKSALQHSAAFWLGVDGKYNNQEMIDALAELWTSQLWI